jgi:hypothetical protein
MSSEIHLKSIIMVTLDEVSEEQCKAFEAHRKAAEEHRKAHEARELQEFHACFKKEKQGKIMPIKKAVLPSTSNETKVMRNVSTLFPSVSPKDVNNMIIYLLRRPHSSGGGSGEGQRISQ